MGIYLIIIILLVASSYLIKKNPDKYKNIDIYFLIVIVLIMVFNNNNPDYEAYKNMFDNNDPNGLAESGFMFLINAVKFLGMNQYVFILIIMGALVFYSILKWRSYTKKIDFLILLYFIFPFMMDIIQIRNTFMVFLVLNSIFHHVKKEKIKSILFALIATQFHSFAFVFIIILIILNIFDYYDFKVLRNKIFYIGLAVVSMINLLFGKSLIEGIILNVPIKNFEKLTFYLRADLNLDSIIVWGVIIIVDVYIFRKLIIKYKLENKREITVLYNILLLSIPLIGCMAYLNEFNRIFRLMFLIKYILYSIIRIQIEGKIKIYMDLYFIGTSLMLGIIYYLRGINYDQLILDNIMLNK